MSLLISFLLLPFIFCVLSALTAVAKITAAVWIEKTTKDKEELK